MAPLAGAQFGGSSSAATVATNLHPEQLELRQAEPRLARRTKLIECRFRLRPQHSLAAAGGGAAGQESPSSSRSSSSQRSGANEMKLDQQTRRGQPTRSRATFGALDTGHRSFKLNRRSRNQTAARLTCVLLLGVAIGCGQLASGQLNDSSPSAAASATTTATTTTTTTTPTPAIAGTTLDPLDPNSGANETPASNMNVVTKLKPINFTLVDELFESSLTEDELVKRWKNMDAQFQDGIRSILKLVFPQIVAISQDAKVSGDCSGGILKWILSLRNLRSWAIKMLDATGKPTAGIFEGSLTMFGNYRQCLSIRAPDEDEIEITDQFEEYFRGQFCVLHLKPWMPSKSPFYHLNSTIEPLLRKNYKYYEKTLYDELAEIAIAFNFIDIRMDLCVPSTCTMADIQRVADLLSRKLEMRSKVMRCDTSPREQTGATLLPGSDQLDRLTTATWFILPVVLVSLVVVCSLLDALDLTREADNKLTRLFKCFTVQEILGLRWSAPSSDQLTLSAEERRERNQSESSSASLVCAQRKPLPLYGLRNLFVFWFIIVQMTVELKYQYLRESLVLRNMLLSYWPFQIIINSTLLFDSIISITAFTYSYSNLESTFKELIGYVFDKYLRLAPAIVAVVALTIFTPLLAIESPVWKNFVEQQADICKSTGYLDLFFLQNFISYEKVCIPHTWLLCVEFQLVLISIPLLILLKKLFVSYEDSITREQSASKSKQTQSSAGALSANHFKLALGHLVASKAGLVGLTLILLGALTNFLLVYLNQLPPSWFFTFPDVAQKNYYFGKYLSKTWVHLTSFFIGLFAGHLCRATLQLDKLRLIKDNRRVTASLSTPSSNAGSPATPPALRHNPEDNISSSNNSLGGFHSSANSSQSIVSLAPRSSGCPATRTAGRDECRVAVESTVYLSLQLSALVSMIAIIFSTYSWSTNETPSPLVAALYDCLSRLVWSLGLAVVMVRLCLPGKNNTSYTLAGRFFSHRIFIVLGRLSFLAYLVAPYVHTLVLAVEEQSMFPSLFLIFHVVVGNIVIIYLVSFVISILVEQPIRLAFSRLVGQTPRSLVSYCVPLRGAKCKSEQASRDQSAIAN